MRPSRDRARLWSALAEVLDGNKNTTVRLDSPERGSPLLSVPGIAPLHVSLRACPVLHLDATMRPAIARRLLPGLTVTEIEAAAPHMHVRLINGSFGKSSLCPDPRANEQENTRRRRKMEAVRDYVRWHAARHAPGKVLVVTYKDIEHAFARLPDVQVAHFNAVAGLDCHKDIDLLIVVGRPLPSSQDIGRKARALFGEDVQGGYSNVVRAVRLRSGGRRAVTVAGHEQPTAEVLRAAICDDEVLQVIGRGRGVNRGAENPLEVHVLADVALPLVHDSISSWDLEAPDVVQRMLLAGMAVDSPADAVALHPSLFGSEKQAEKAFERTAFNRQTPVRDLYREMSVKSAAYRRPGRGRGWQRAWWFGMRDDEARAWLESTLGTLAEWRA